MSLCGTECWNNYVKQSNSFASGEETKEEKEEEKEEKREKELLQNNPLFERLSLLINYNKRNTHFGNKNSLTLHVSSSLHSFILQIMCRYVITLPA